MYLLPDAHETYDRPNGTFLGGFYWVQPYGLADYEEEWGRKWIDGIDLELAISHPFYDRTGRTRPFSDKEELNARRLRAADSKADSIWTVLGYKISELVFDEAQAFPVDIWVNSEELADLIWSLEDL